MNATLEAPRMAEATAAPTTTRPGLIYAKMAQIMGKVGAVGKNGQATDGVRYAYRKIEDIYAHVQKLMAEHGVFSLGEVVDQVRETRPRSGGGVLTFTVLTIRHTFYAEDGSSVQDVTVGEAMDTSDKSCNKATSAAEKYSLLTAFKIPTEDLKDSETETPQAAAPAAAPRKPHRPGPAPVVQAPAFTQQLRAALENRGHRGDEVERALKGIAEAFEVTDLERLGPAERGRALRGIAQGQADRFKELATAAG